MTEQTRAVFSDPKLLREKLNEFLQTPDTVEIYAQAAEKFFEAGNREKLELVGTWSLCSFFLNMYMLLYRKCYMAFFIFLIIISIIELMEFGTIIILFCILLAIRFKYYVIKRFEKALDLGQIEFAKMSGRHKYLPWIFFILLVSLYSLQEIS